MSLTVRKVHIFSYNRVRHLCDTRWPARPCLVTPRCGGNVDVPLRLLTADLINYFFDWLFIRHYLQSSVFRPPASNAHLSVSGVEESSLSSFVNKKQSSRNKQSIHPKSYSISLHIPLRCTRTKPGHYANKV